MNVWILFSAVGSTIPAMTGGTESLQGAARPPVPPRPGSIASSTFTASKYAMILRNLM